MCPSSRDQWGDAVILDDRDIVGCRGDITRRKLGRIPNNLVQDVIELLPEYQLMRRKVLPSVGTVVTCHENTSSSILSKIKGYKPPNKPCSTLPLTS